MNSIPAYLVPFSVGLSISIVIALIFALVKKLPLNISAFWVISICFLWPLSLPLFIVRYYNYQKVATKVKQNLVSGSNHHASSISLLSVVIPFVIMVGAGIFTRITGNFLVTLYLIPVSFLALFFGALSFATAGVKQRTFSVAALLISTIPMGFISSLA